MNGRLWAFSGIDGAGKTSQIELLLARLKREGRPARRVWARGGYTPLFELAKGLLRKISLRAMPKPGHSQERTQRFRRPLVRKIWLLLSIFDFFLYYGIWVRWLLFTGRIVVTDRWVIDTDLDFKLNFPEEKVERWISWRFAKLLLPSPTEHFILLIPVGESQRRSIEKDEPFPDSAEVLEKRLKLYQSAIVVGMGLEMDGLRTREELHDEVTARCGLKS